jgi:hypothetical protein
MAANGIHHSMPLGNSRSRSLGSTCRPIVVRPSMNSRTAAMTFMRCCSLRRISPRSAWAKSPEESAMFERLAIGCPRVEDMLGNP